MMNQNFLKHYDSDDEELFCSSAQKACKPSTQDINKKVKEAEKFLKTLENIKKNRAWCKICNMELKSAIHAQKHYCSVNHLKKLEELKEKGLQQILLPAATGLQSYCSICEVIKCGDDHLESEEHKSRNLEPCSAATKTISKEALQQKEIYSILHCEKVKKLQSCVWQDKSSMAETSPQVSEISNQSTAVNDHFSIPRGSSPAENKNTTLLSEIYCSVCNVNYPRDQFYNHVSEFPHSSMGTLNTQHSPEIINSLYSVSNGTVIVCNLCHITMKSPNDVQSHVKGIKHIKKFKNRFPEHVFEDNKLKTSFEDTVIAKPIEDVVLNTCLEDNKSKDFVKQNYIETPEKVMETTTTNMFFCYLCKQSFHTKIELNVHTIRFPHVEMAKWKSEVVSLGVPYAEYWVHSKTSLTCTLCNIDVFNVIASKSHMNGSNHKTNLAEWCKEFASWKLGDVVDPKHFYCNSCQIRLPGTSEAQHHYNTSEHLQKQELYCNICKKPNESETKLLEHQMSQEHKGNLFKVSEKQGNELGTISVDAQIFEQVDKLVNTLYYSDTVPQHIALEYLKKFNSEVEKLKTKYEEHKVKLRCQEIESGGSDSSNTEFEMDFSLDKCDKKYKLENFVANKQFGEEVLRVTIEEKQDKPLKKNSEVKKTRQTSKFQSTKPPDNLRCLKQPNFFDMYLDVINWKLQITKSSTEKDILDEITKLIRIISSPAVPLEKILELLQSFNMVLDSTVFKFTDKNR